MGGDKTEYTSHLNDNHIEWLRQAARDFALDDEHKALRILIDYAMTEGDNQQVFTPMRCLHC